MTIKYLSREKINEAISEAVLSSDKEYMIIILFAKTGIRVSELLGVTPNDILVDQKQLTVRGKGDKIRNVDVPSHLINGLLLYIKTHNIKKREKIIKLTRQRIYQITKKIAGVNPHMFRHSYAIHLLRKTKNIRYVQVQLGHETILTTQIYLRYMDFEEEKNTLNDLYSGN